MRGNPLPAFFQLAAVLRYTTTAPFQNVVHGCSECAVGTVVCEYLKRLDHHLLAYGIYTLVFDPTNRL